MAVTVFPCTDHMDIFLQVQVTSISLKSYYSDAFRHFGFAEGKKFHSCSWAAAGGARSKKTSLTSNADGVADAVLARGRVTPRNRTNEGATIRTNERTRPPKKFNPHTERGPTHDCSSLQEVKSFPNMIHKKEPSLAGILCQFLVSTNH